MRAISQRLHDIYSLLRGHFGYAHRWWPGSSTEIVLTAILVQRCDWSDARAAVLRLRKQGLLSLTRLAAATPHEVLNHIQGVAFAPTKAKRLIGLARTFLSRGHRVIDSYLSPTRETATLRKELLELAEVGPETADCMLLFGSEHASFVVDEYTCRVFRRLGLFPEVDDRLWSRPNERLRQFFEAQLTVDPSLYAGLDFAPGVPRDVALFRDYHALLVELAKHHCLRNRPHCDKQGKTGWRNYRNCRSHCRATCRSCPLAGICAAARTAGS